MFVINISNFLIVISFQMNQMELSPNYAGTLRGFTNTLSNLTGFIAPLIAGAITNTNVSTIPTPILTRNML